jgi:hypothetical protein
MATVLNPDSTTISDWCVDAASYGKADSLRLHDALAMRQDQPLSAGTALLIMEPDGTWHEPRLSQATMKYLESEAKARGISFADMYREYRNHETRVDKLMPIDQLDAIATPPVEGWLDDVGWKNHAF